MSVVRAGGAGAEVRELCEGVRSVGAGWEVEGGAGAGCEGCARVGGSVRLGKGERARTRRTLREPSPPIENRLNSPNPGPPPPPASADDGVCSAAPALTTRPSGCIILNGSVVGDVDVEGDPDEVEVVPFGGEAAKPVVLIVATELEGETDRPAEVLAAPAEANESDPRRWRNESVAGGLRGPIAAGDGPVEPAPAAGHPHLAPPAKRLLEMGGVRAGGGEGASSSSSIASSPRSNAISGPSHTPPRVAEGFPTFPFETERALPVFVAGRAGAAAEEGDDEGVGSEPAEVPASDDDEGEVERPGTGGARFAVPVAASLMTMGLPWFGCAPVEALRT